MKIKRSFSDIIFDSINTLFMIMLMVVTIYPFIYVLMGSFSNPDLFMQDRGLLIKPVGFSLDAYKAVFRNPMILSGYKNTIIYVVVGTAINLFFSILGAYGLSRKNVLFKKPIMIFITFTMFFNGGLIPNYLLINDLHMRNTLWAIILPGAISTWNLFVMRTSMQGIPESFEESARIDGANDLMILLKVIIPLSMPVIAVMILFYGVGHWNSWFAATIYITKRELLPLQVIIREILLMSNTNSMTIGLGDASDKTSLAETVKLATIIVATVPILMIYPFLQKYFVKGVMVGGIKE
jgi:putative aldouronate transport system permease protein